MKKYLVGAGLVMGSAVAAVAGGLADAIVEQDPVVVTEVAETGGSVPGWVIPVAILAVIGLAVASSGDDDDPEPYQF